MCSKKQSLSRQRHSTNMLLIYDNNANSTGLSKTYKKLGQGKNLQ